MDALDRAAGGPGSGRGYYVPTGNVTNTGAPLLVLRSDVSGWLFNAHWDDPGSLPQHG